jgi:TolB-like protein/Tfp pilus assembly protein PilF
MAILPFKPIIAAQRDEALELGMADSLIGSISRSDGVVVRPLSAVRRYGNLEQDPLLAGRELQVDAVLDGTIHHAGGRIRVTARLLRVADAKQLWQGQFDENLSGIFAVQDSISRRLAEELPLRIAEPERARDRQTENVEAYRAYALGVMHVQRLNRDEINAGIADFQRATVLDPRYAAAYAAMAGAYAILPVSSEAPPAESFRAARVAAKKAVELAPDLAEAHLVLGTIAFWADWDWAASEASLRRAVALEPGNASARTRYAHLLSNIGHHEEARVQIAEALRIDPLSRLVNTLAGQFALQAGDVDAAISQLQHALRIDPEFWIAHVNLGKAYQLQGRFDDALRELEHAHRGAGLNVEALAMIGYVHGVSGDRAAARRVLAEIMAISRKRPVAASKIALVHLGLGERAQAVRWLSQACRDRDVGLTFLRVNPRWSQLRDEPGFREIQRCANLPE